MKKRYTIYLEPEVYEAVKAYASSIDADFSTLARRALKTELKRRGVSYQSDVKNESPAQDKRLSDICERLERLERSVIMISHG